MANQISYVEIVANSNKLKSKISVVSKVKKNRHIQINYSYM